jgi:hypothetical protein
MNTLNDDPIKILVDEINAKGGGLMAINMQTHALIININIKGDTYVTVADYDGVGWLLKVYIGGVFAFENITTTPVALSAVVLSHEFKTE